MIHAKPVVIMPKERRGIARLYGELLVIIWDGGLAQKPGTAADLEALPDEVHPGDLAGFSVVERGSPS